MDPDTGGPKTRGSGGSGFGSGSGTLVGTTRQFFSKGVFYGFLRYFLNFSTLFHLLTLRFHLSEAAGIESRTVATFAFLPDALKIRLEPRSYHIV
jgi:hypothetical protein